MCEARPRAACARALLPTAAALRVAPLAHSAPSSPSHTSRSSRTRRAPDPALRAEDPRASRWREALRAAGAAPPSAADGLAADASPLSEALNVAWAAHEFTAEHADEVLAFWLRHLPEVEYRAWREGSHRAG